ncbi:unnamed protein product [Rhodiola kirilowii]
MNERNSFYVVKKGDIIGVYKSLSDSQIQVGSSIESPSVSVYKGYSLSSEAEAYLASHGLKNAAFTVSANDVKDGLFGELLPCPFQQPDMSKEKMPSMDSSKKRPRQELEMEKQIFGPRSPLQYPIASTNMFTMNEAPGRKSSICQSCTIEFDGASKGNPGISGAGAIVRADDGSMVCRLREGVGIATNNVAEYRSVILGLKYAFKKGFKHVRVKGDSNLVCMQVKGLWKTRNQNMADLCKVTKELKAKFLSFQIDHVPRELNSQADAQANLAVNLRDGEVREEYDK